MRRNVVYMNTEDIMNWRKTIRTENFHKIIESINRIRNDFKYSYYAKKKYNSAKMSIIMTDSNIKFVAKVRKRRNFLKITPELFDRNLDEIIQNLQEYHERISAFGQDTAYGRVELTFDIAVGNLDIIVSEPSY